MKWLVIAALLVAGCKKKHEEGTSVATTTGSAAMTGSAAAPEPVAVGSAAAPAAVDVPTEQDFEQQAAKDIDAKNVDSKLKTLENDLAH